MWQLVASSMPMLVGIESCFMIFVSSISWCTISSSFNSPCPEFIDIFWLDAPDCASLCKLNTIFLNRLHSTSRVEFFNLCCTNVPIIDANQETNWCSLSQTFDVTKNIEFLLHWIISSWDRRIILIYWNSLKSISAKLRPKYLTKSIKKIRI